jgi:hypothetical protein
VPPVCALCALTRHPTAGQHNSIPGDSGPRVAGMIGAW